MDYSLDIDLIETKNIKSELDNILKCDITEKNLNRNIISCCKKIFSEDERVFVCNNCSVTFSIYSRLTN